MSSVWECRHAMQANNWNKHASSLTSKQADTQTLQRKPACQQTSKHAVYTQADKAAGKVLSKRSSRNACMQKQKTPEPLQGYAWKCNCQWKKWKMGHKQTSEMHARTKACENTEMQASTNAYKVTKQASWDSRKAGKEVIDASSKHAWQWSINSYK